VDRPQQRDKGMRRVSRVTACAAGVGAGLVVAFAVHAADAIPGHAKATAGSTVTSTTVAPLAGGGTQPPPLSTTAGAVPSTTTTTAPAVVPRALPPPAPIPRHTRTGGS
jgi:hypothetical protein